MESILHLDLTALIKTFGYIGIFAIIFAESGLLIGIFLPGDSILFGAGFLASQGFLKISWVLAVTLAGAILGDNVGYAFGKRVGPKIFKKEDSLLFHKDHLEKARVFFEKHGGKTLIIARFMPVIRALAPILAGVGGMKYKRFFIYNIIGGILWAVLIPLIGYFLGSIIPNIENYLHFIIIGITVTSILLSFMHILKTKEDRERAKRVLIDIKNKILRKK